MNSLVDYCNKWQYIFNFLLYEIAESISPTPGRATQLSYSEPLPHPLAAKKCLSHSLPWSEPQVPLVSHPWLAAGRTKAVTLRKLLRTELCPYVTSLCEAVSLPNKHRGSETLCLTITFSKAELFDSWLNKEQRECSSYQHVSCLTSTPEAGCSW